MQNLTNITDKSYVSFSSGRLEASHMTNTLSLPPKEHRVGLFAALLRSSPTKN